jgi:hypothetical protein
MSTPDVGIDRGMKPGASPEPTHLLFGNFFKMELKETRSRFTDGSKAAERPFGGFSVFDYHEDKDWDYRTSQIASTFTLEAVAISESLTRINEILGLQERDDCHLIVQKLWKEIPTHLPHYGAA